MEEVLEKISYAISNKLQIHHVVVNAAKIVYMNNDHILYQSVVEADMVNADGAAVVWASKILGKPLPERVTGIDLMENIISLSNKNGYSIYFLGATEEVVNKVVEGYKNKYSVSIIAGYRNGYFSQDEEGLVVQEIVNSGADILLVAMSSPAKEIFLNKYKSKITSSFIMGVGGSFDVVSGLVKRAPLWMQNYGLEWLYRLYQEPRRMWKRYLFTNSIFIWLVIKELFMKLRN